MFPTMHMHTCMCIYICSYNAILFLFMCVSYILIYMLIYILIYLELHGPSALGHRGDGGCGDATNTTVLAPCASWLVDLMHCKPPAREQSHACHDTAVMQLRRAGMRAWRQQNEHEAREELTDVTPARGTCETTGVCAHRLCQRYTVRYNASG